jgi:hypothetical protein
VVLNSDEYNYRSREYAANRRRLVGTCLLGSVLDYYVIVDALK